MRQFLKLLGWLVLIFFLAETLFALFSGRIKSRQVFDGRFWAQGADGLLVDALPMVVVVGIVLAAAWWIPTLWAVRQYAQADSGLLRGTFSADTDGINFEDAKGNQARWRWETVKTVVEGKSAFLFRLKTGIIAFVSTDNFTHEQINQLRALIADSGVRATSRR